MSANSNERDLAAESTAQGGTGTRLTTELIAETYLLAIFKPPADEPEARPVARFCDPDSDRVDALFMHATNMAGLYVLDMTPDGTNIVPQLLTVVDVVRCEVPERGSRLVTKLTTSCGMHFWVPGVGTLDSLEPSYRICCFSPESQGSVNDQKSRPNQSAAALARQSHKEAEVRVNRPST